MQEKTSLRFIVQAGLIAALYIVLTLLVKPLGFGPLQFRLSEILVLLPAALPAAVPGLFIGCFLANILGGLGIIDIVFGSLASLLAALLTSYLGQRFTWQEPKLVSRSELSKEPSLYLLPLPSIIFNALIVGFYLAILFPPEGPFLLGMLLGMLQLALSEAVTVYLLGISFFLAIYPLLARESLTS